MDRSMQNVQVYCSQSLKIFVRAERTANKFVDLNNFDGHSILDLCDGISDFNFYFML